MKFNLVIDVVGVAVGTLGWWLFKKVIVLTLLITMLQNAIRKAVILHKIEKNLKKEGIQAENIVTEKRLRANPARFSKF